jgi:hypothetical protein
MSRSAGFGFVLSFLVVGTPGSPGYSQPQGQYPDPSLAGPPGGLGSNVGDQGQPPPDVAGPPVARLSIVNGGVSVRRGDSPDPVAAVPNAPVLAGDTIAVGAGGRAEVQFDFANRLRLGNAAEARMAEMQPGRYHIELAHGTATFSVFRDSRAQVEVSTPNVSIRPLAQGQFRVWVRDDGQTVVTVRAGEAEIYTQRGSQRVHQGQTMFVRGTAQDPEYQIAAAGALDEWDNWNQERDRMLDSARSYQYVSPEVTGAQDLDAYGQWVNDPSYGEVWTPRVSPGWTPYGDGSWTWEDYYGWTWVGAEPWGWAPYHYGNWFYGSAGWCWWPGLRAGVFFRPALVGFFGFGNFLGIGLGFGGWGHVGWVPLAPYERFSPWYGRGGYGFGSRLINASVVAGYRNARVGNALHGVDAGSFTSGRFSNIARLDPTQVARAGLVRGGLPVTPTANNLRFGNQRATVTPHAFTANSHFYSRTPSAPVQRTSFQQQQQSMARASAPRSYAPSQSAAVSRPAAGAGAGASGWSRFGTPNRVSPSASSPGARSGSGWGSFGSAPAASGAYQRSGSSPGYGQSRSYGQSGQQSLRIAPPIVHDRAYDAPSRGYSAPSYRAPQYSAPHYSAPPASHPSGGGGGGGHSAAPAAHSGGGGGHGGGGHSGGGGGGHHR